MFSLLIHLLPIHIFFLGVVVQACNPRTWEAEAEGWQVQANLCYIVRPCLKNTKEFFFLIALSRPNTGQ
jgi:hypothetical protein